MKKAVKLFGILCFLWISKACVQKTHVKTVTFQVDMTAVENIADVGIRGEFTDTPWQETVFMTDEDKDGIYEITIEQKTAKNRVNFKFVNQKDQFELLGKDNRVLNFQYQPETITYKAIFDDSENVRIQRK